MHKPEVHLYLDLEDTIIPPALDGFANLPLINVDKVKYVIEKYKPDYLHIFSFAIYNEHDYKSFAYHLQGRIQDAVGMPVTHVTTVDQIVEKVFGSLVNRVDVLRCGKTEVFRTCMLDALITGARDPDDLVILLDDSVETRVDTQMGISIHFVKMESD